MARSVIFNKNNSSLTYCRKSKTWKNRETNSNAANNEKNSKKANKQEKTAILTRMDIELAVGQLQLLNLQYRFFETGADLGLYITQFTKALTELPLKLVFVSFCQLFEIFNL